MLNTRSRLVAFVATVVFCVQIFAPGFALAQTAPEPPHTETFSTPPLPAAEMSIQSTNEAHAEFPPTGLTPSPMPDQGTISAEMVTVLSNAVTSAGHVVIDFGSLAGGVMDHGTNNFANVGTIYAISTNPEITNATISAQNIFNQTGATITTILPEGGLSGYTNLVSNLNLSLSAVESVVNAGTISSAGNLNVTAGTSIINALPSMLPPEIIASAPLMQAANNLNLVSSNITNAGVMESIGSSINISTPTAQNIVVNNVGGTLTAFDAINVRDFNFAGKFNTFLLGGNVIAERLNVYSGDGLAKLQVNVMTPALTLLAGDGYVSTLSDLRIATVLYTGDPIHISGGDVIFESDVDPITGEKTGVVTGGGTFSGRNAIIASDVDTISISGAIIDLTGSADLSRLPISVASSLKINAVGNINVSNVGAGSAIILQSSGGNVTAGTLSAASFIQLQAAGDVNAGSVTSNAGGVIVHGANIEVSDIKALNQPGFVDIKAQSASPLVVGGAGANISSITMTGTSPTGEAWVNIDNPSGVIISSPSAIAINTPFTVSGLSINAQNGTVVLPSGTMNLNSNHPFVPAGNFAVSALNVIADGTTISARNTAGGPGGLIFLGATTINRGTGGLTLITDGGENMGWAGIGIGGRESVLIQTQFSGGFNQRLVNYSGTIAAPFALIGSGQLTASSNGTISGGSIFVDSLSTATFSGGPMIFRADGVGNAHGGFVQVFNNQIVNATQGGITLSADGAGNGHGGFAQAVANLPGSNLTIAPGRLSLSSQSGSGQGHGGTIDAKAGGTLTVDPTAISTGAVGTQGSGGRLTLVGGTTGTTGGGLVFSTQAVLNNNGAGSGKGGLIQLGSFSSDSNVTFYKIHANGGASGEGGTIFSDVGRNITIGSGGEIQANGNSARGGTIDLNAGFGGSGVMTILGRASANGSTGGTVTLRHHQASTSTSPGLTLDAGTVDANGTESGGSITVRNENSGAALQISALPASRLSAIASNSDGRMGTLNFKQPSHGVSVTSSGAELSGRIVSEGSSVNITTTTPRSVLTVESAKATNGSVRIVNTGDVGRIDMVGLPGVKPQISATTAVTLEADELNLGIRAGSNQPTGGTASDLASITGHSVSLLTNAFNTSEATGNIRLAANVTASGPLIVDAEGVGGNITQYAGLLQAQSTELRSNGGIIAGSERVFDGDSRDSLLVWTDSLTANTGIGMEIGRIDVEQRNPADDNAERPLLLNQSTAGSRLFIRSSGQLTVAGEVFAPREVDLETFSGDLIINNQVKTDGQLTLLSGAHTGGQKSGNIIHATSAPAVSGAVIRLGARVSNIGTAAAPLRISSVVAADGSDLIRVDPDFSTKNAYLKVVSTGDAHFGDSTVSGTLSISTIGSIKPLVLDGALGSTVISADSLILHSDNGSIGQSASRAGAIRVNAANLTVTTGATGEVFLRSERLDPVTVKHVAVGPNFFLRSQSTVNIAGAMTAQNGFTVETATGSINVGPSSIIVRNDSLSAKIVLAANVKDALEPGSTEPDLDPSSRVNLAAGAILNAVSPGGARVDVYSRNVVLIPALVSLPGLTVSPSGGGQIFLGDFFLNGGDNSIISNGNAVVSVNGVVFGGSNEIMASSAIPGPDVPPPGRGGTPPPKNQPVPGLSGAPGQTDFAPPGQVKTFPPGHFAPPPGQSINNPGQGVTVPPGMNQRVQGGPQNTPQAHGEAQTIGVGQDDEEYIPVAFVNHAPSFGQEPALLKTDDAVFWCNHATDLVQSRTGKLRLGTGETIVSAVKDLTIHVGNVQVTLPVGTIVAIDKHEKYIRVLCLHETGASPLIKASGSSASIQSGQMFLVSDSSYRETIATRKSSRLKNTDGRSEVCEFSLPSAVQRITALRSLLAGKQPDLRKIAQSVMKTGAAMIHATSQHGNYNVER